MRIENIGLFEFMSRTFFYLNNSNYRDAFKKILFKNSLNLLERQIKQQID